MRIRSKVIWMLLASAICLDTEADAQARFSEVARTVGINFIYGNGAPAGGVSFVDFNRDGLDDITFAGGSGRPLAFYLNTGNGFSLVQPPPVNLDFESKQVLWADFDNDGDKDLFVTTRDSRNYLFRNNGNLVMQDVTAEAGLSMDAEPSFGAAWGDFDRDGWLDLVVTSRKIGLETIVSTNRLYHNKGDGTFDDVTLPAGLTDDVKSPFCVSFIDFDNDLWPDIYVAQDKRTLNSLFVNQHNGTFTDRGSSLNADTNMFGMSVACADVDQNGTQDIYITNTVGSKLLINHLNGFTEEARLRGVDFVGGYGWGASFLDGENDGDQDLYVSGMLEGGDVVSSAYYENSGLGNFTSSQAGFDSDTLSSYSNATGDFNDDGFSDIVVLNADTHFSQLWKNQSGSNAWIKVRLLGRISNRDGTGARIEVFSEGKGQSHFTSSGVSYLGQNSDWIPFGLSSADVIDSIVVHWPSGHVDRLYDVAVRQKLNIEEATISPVTAKLNVDGLLQLCAGDSALLHAGLTGSGFTFLWSTGETISEIVVKESGSYSVEIHHDDVNLHWSSPSVAVEVLETAAPNVIMDVQPVSCYGFADGSIRLTLDGGTDPIYISWSTGEVGPELVDISAGFYQVKVTDGLSCEVVKSVVVEEPEPFFLEHKVVNTSFGKFAIQLIRYGGLNPVSYVWSVPGAPDRANLTNLDPGEYSVVATDAMGCKTNLTAHVEAVDAITSTQSEQRGILCYPNPVTANLMVRIDAHASACVLLTVVNVVGQESAMRYCLGSRGEEIEVPRSMLFPGLNMITVLESGGTIHQAKVVVR